MNWHFASDDIGAFPQFERLDDVTGDYDAFAATLLRQVSVGGRG